MQTSSATIEFEVIKDQCLGKTVYRGSLPAKELLPACWIDFHDLDRNPLGYQRPFDQERSKQAAEYAENASDGYWPECVLSIRKAGDAEEAETSPTWSFNLSNPGGQYGKLSVKYDVGRVEMINGKAVPWKRAFSQIDCQHRLGNLGNSAKYVTVSVFTDLTQRDEAIIFRTINSKQKPLGTSLVDMVLIATDPNAPRQLRWAYDLGSDVGSALFKLVGTGGRDPVPPTRLVNLRTMHECCRTIVPTRLLVQGGEGLGYDFLRNYWNVIKELWPTQFVDAKTYKLMTVPGLKGLARFSGVLFRELIDVQDISKERIRLKFGSTPENFDWSNSGPLRDATGNAGARIVFQALRTAFP